MREPTYHDGIKDVIAYWQERALIAERQLATLRLNYDLTVAALKEARDALAGKDST